VRNPPQQASQSTTVNVNRAARECALATPLRCRTDISARQNGIDRLGIGCNVEILDGESLTVGLLSDCAVASPQENLDAQAVIGADLEP